MSLLTPHTYYRLGSFFNPIEYAAPLRLLHNVIFETKKVIPSFDIGLLQLKIHKYTKKYSCNVIYKDNHDKK